MSVIDFIVQEQALRKAPEEELRRFAKDCGGQAMGELPTSANGWQACFRSWLFARRGQVVMVEAA